LRKLASLHSDTNELRSRLKTGHKMKMMQKCAFEKFLTHPDTVEFAYFDLYLKSNFKVSFSRETLS
jgi:hypothetical protein